MASAQLTPEQAAEQLCQTVRRLLKETQAHRVAVACSGGPDSLALAAATLSLRTRPWVGVITVDHQLQAGSAAAALVPATQLAQFAPDAIEVAKVDVVATGQGPEAAARSARYAALNSWCDTWQVDALLLGHTLDDQAETVLLGLVRGSGPTAWAGMPAHRGRLLRPFLDTRRATVQAALAHWQLTPWHDPHNEDSQFTRVRARHDALPALELALGPGIAAGLARGAKLAQEDNSALAEWASRVLAEAQSPAGLAVAPLEKCPTAITTRVIRSWLVAAGVPKGSLQASHLQAASDLVHNWRGQGLVYLPAGKAVVRGYDNLVVRASPRSKHGPAGS